MGTKAGIVYATKSTMVRRIIHPDRDAELDDPALVMKGESILVVDRASGVSLAECEAAVAKHTGKKTPSTRCVVLDANGEVERIIHADPELDTIPDRKLVLHPSAKLGDRL